MWWLVVVVVFLVSGSTALAADDPDITMEPAEVDAFSCQFPGRTLTAVGAGVTAKLVGEVAQADASPSGIISGAAISGDKLNFVITPDAGCGASGCRNGNNYQITCQPTEGTSKPTGNLLLKVQQVHKVPSGGGGFF